MAGVGVCRRDGSVRRSRRGERGFEEEEEPRLCSGRRAEGEARQGKATA
jgi:hypothetical protein